MDGWLDGWMQLNANAAMGAYSVPAATENRRAEPTASVARMSDCHSGNQHSRDAHSRSAAALFCRPSCYPAKTTISSRNDVPTGPMTSGFLVGFLERMWLEARRYRDRARATLGRTWEPDVAGNFNLSSCSSSHHAASTKATLSCCELRREAPLTDTSLLLLMAARPLYHLLTLP